MAISNLVTSPHCVCYINSVPFARCCGLNFDILTPRKEIRGIDTLEIVELAPVSVSVRGSLQVYRFHRDGGIEAAGLAATFDSLTREKYASMMVMDRLTDTVLMQVNRFCVQHQNWAITPRAFVIGTVSFTGIDCSNDASSAR
jgi:hypothetical protein